MAHEVTMDIATKFVLHKDVKVEVKSNGSKLGTLLISKGNIEWLSSGAHVNKKRLTWAQFAKLIEGEGKPTKVKKRAPKKAAKKKPASPK
ncbi:hypothetical protein ACI6Q5_18715 [Xanthomonas codiaei]|uniref:Uncharacterized protein n=2 Tax=Xanthomonas codiaei TaxID=56463 RepID=A0A2S7CF19_9XANT|nr:hypothetical protein XcodCFBP4690_18345 [Xanthomonas codiaei]